ncbi:MAG: hypothetical protein L6V85_05325 [Clostridiales bacterium]|nr:MAG: hypothetical protein L6V85_05325 [Clostridiales bacterium]
MQKEHIDFFVKKSIVKIYIDIKTKGDNDNEKKRKYLIVCFFGVADYFSRLFFPAAPQKAT